ncbi:EamA-like transporter family protein [Brasilonema octagenarum UFV-E1]|uniref:EamA-like transporter family protein n=3 Tax=Scytonemataceae TaxID=1182 RepID=A0A856MKY8_9CYAN|nr:EamA-like transporter family protein [Brasilonema octagenarum UFV-OR1]QDL12043.1 EamA-like transporter family protein [Brasilonema sennae CENA114]QDL18420.1 EamA-like transporter family protein [Brasilonema octagenarum UFV-E1]
MSVMASVGGQFFLKLGALKLASLNPANTIGQILNIATTPELLIGLSCYGLGAIAYILLLTKVNLSIAGPSVSLVYVFSVLLGYFIFKESIPLIRLVGLSFIICGVILVIWHK